jgi:regulator of protease activity HflC (stomatin/prohibitin superfamily)
MRRWILLLSIGWLLAACSAVETSQQIIVQADEIAVVIDSATGDLKEPLQPGTHTINTLDERVVFYPTFVQLYAFTGSADANADFATSAPAITATTSDNLPVTLSLGVAFRVNPASVNSIHAEWAGTPGDYRAGYVRVVTRLITQTVVSAYSAAELQALPRADLAARITTPLGREFEMNGFVLERVDIYDVR